MRKSLLRYFWNVEYLFGALLVLLMVRFLYVISDSLPETDETSFLDPIFSRIDFLNIKDVSLDAIFAMREKQFPDNRIVVVNIGESAPVPDGKIALFLRKAHEWGAKVIGVDALFDQQHFERFGPEDQWQVDELKKALREVPNVVLASGFNQETRREEIRIDPEIRATVRHYGYVNLFPDEDNVVRRFWPFRTVEGERQLYFPIKLLELYDSTLIAPLYRLPEDQQIVFYTSTVREFQTPSLNDVLTNQMYASWFKDKIVLLGLVDERGLVYMGDMHKTPMGRKTPIPQTDGTVEMGVEGPDMAGVLIHANVMNMFLKGQFIDAVPEWVDWLFSFLLAYISIALYRVVRTKPRTKMGVGFLIGTFLIVETIIVFFLPILCYFYLYVKISYHLMATTVLLFIPANAWIAKARYGLLHARISRRLRHVPAPVTAPVRQAFRDDESFPSYMGSIHASLFYLHYAMAIEASLRLERGEMEAPFIRFSLLHEWRALLPSIESICLSTGIDDRRQHFFYAFLEGKKLSHLRDAELKNLFFSTQFDLFNEHVYFEEWDVLLPRLRQLYEKDLPDYQQYLLFLLDREQSTSPRVESIGFMERTPRIDPSRFGNRPAGTYALRAGTDDELIQVSPFCEYTECKLHRKRELFVYAGLIQKQEILPPLPAYYGETISCEPILRREMVDWFRCHMIGQPEG